jgi:ArsR family transcriptional regulator
MDKLSRSECEASARVLRALGHPLRLGVVQELAVGECSVSDLVSRLGCSQPMMSQQLRTLEQQGLIKCRKVGTTKYCSLRNSDFLRLFECLKRHLEMCFKL